MYNPFPILNEPLLVTDWPGENAILSGRPIPAAGSPGSKLHSS